MQLYYFGTGAKPLFGVHHPAQGETRRRESVVLCPPIGTEFLRSYRAFRQLATMLAKIGYDVLRFDYYGTGDSSGDCLESSLEQWQTDIAIAIEEVQEVSGARNTSLVGLRIGATLAAVAAKKHKIKRVVLWEPVVDGEAYLSDRIKVDLENETAIGHQQLLEKNLKNNDPIGIMGFSWSAQFRKEIAEINLDWFSGIQSEKTFLLVREETQVTQGLQDILYKNVGTFGYEHIEHPGEWGEFDAIGSLLLPQATIKAAVACLL